MKSGQFAYFNANVVGTGNLTVTWSVNGIPGGDAANGTISTIGAYTAPAALPAPNPVTIKATSVGDTSKSDTASLTVFTLTVSPPNATVFYNHSQQFTATVTGITNPVVTWLSQYEQVNANGLYTADFAVGQNIADFLSVNLANYNGSPTQVPITLQFPTPVLNSITPSAASAYEPVVINGQDIYGVTTVSFPGPFGSLLPANLYPQPSLTQIFATVPF